MRLGRAALLERQRRQAGDRHVRRGRDPGRQPALRPPEQRIATFDNDGTLWVENPIYTQFLFAFDRLKALAPRHPEWQIEQPFKAALAGDMKTVGASGMEGHMKILLATHSGMTASQFAEEAGRWLRTTEHPKFKRPYARSIYQAQIELLEHLRVHGFKTFIFSGGGIAFMRPISQKAYGIPPTKWSAPASSRNTRWPTAHRRSSVSRRSTSSMTW